MTPLLAIVAASAAHAGVVKGEASGLDDVYAARRVAVLVGVQDYADPTLQGLRFPAKDARDLGAALEDPAIGGFDRVFVVEGAESTSRAAIERAIAVASADLQRDDTFLLYLSGHGTLTLDATEGSRLWFLPSDGELSRPEQTGLAIAELEEMVSDLPARRRVLVMDTCHNGRATGGGLAGRAKVNTPTAQLLAGLRGEPPAPRGLREVSESEARLFAAQYHQPAMEDPELQNGVYTHFLLKSLTDQRAAADLDRDGLVDAAEAHDFARDKTIAHTGGMQVPRAEYRIVGKEEIWLAGDPRERRRAEHALLSGVDQVLAQAKLLVDGVARGPAVGLTAVEPGRRDISLVDDEGRTLVRRKVSLEAGATLPVEDLFEEAPSRFVALAGGAAVHGAGSDQWPGYGGELEVGWMAPRRGPHVQWEAHGRVTATQGAVTVAEAPVDATAGLAALGGSVGFGGRAVTVGPQLELGVPWRSFEDDLGRHDQGSVTVVPGARALLLAPLGQRELVVRYDARFVPWRHDAAWTSVWHHGLAVGVTTR